MFSLIGLILLAIGGFFELVGAIGILKLPNFYLRVHALTMTYIGGSLVPLIGAALIALERVELGAQRLYVFGTCVIAAVLILILAPTGTHALMRATYFSNTAPKQPLVYDALEAKKVDKEV